MRTEPSPAPAVRKRVRLKPGYKTGFGKPAFMIGVDLRWIDDGCLFAAFLGVAELTPQIASQSQMGLLGGFMTTSCINKTLTWLAETATAVSLHKVEND